MNLQQLDLNLVLALDALLRHQSVTLAAEELGLSQPAMSHALARLREALGDPLLVREGRGLVPTPAARSMRAPLAAALSSLDTALFPEADFDPGEVQAVVTVALDPYFHGALVPRLVQTLQSRAPGVQVHACMLDLDDLEASTATGRIDVAIAPGHLLLPELDRELLVSDIYRCLLRRDHAVAGRCMTLQDCARFGQVLLSPGGSWAAELARSLRQEGLSPHYVLVTDQLPVALDTVARTDAYMVQPRRVAEQVRGDRLRVVSPPAELGTCSQALYWHPAHGDTPLQRFLRGVIGKLARNLYVRRQL